MKNFICPVCGGRLEQKERSLYCPKGHCYDLAKSGYVNLLLSTPKGAKQHGDDKGMVTARRDFLNQGYYEPLRQAICEELYQRMPEKCRILDAGCGECWYTDGVEQALTRQGKTVSISGVDISKNALQLGAKRNHNLSLAVGSIFHMPVPDERFDGVLHVFAPFCGEEFCRVLKKGGYLLSVMPLENHLMGLKQAIYDKPYPNEVCPPQVEGLNLLTCREVRKEITLRSQQDIQNLFQMTPYYYKTGVKDQAKLQAYDQLTTQLEFGIFLYQKN
jgi:23S rRNA (guanine745-N1)-methyltransferase